ncbi:fibronectin type III domain-containing protein [Actinoplanes missouriensis]|uniref:fibronectin type III domain-containing protein n=1 Tax=Actinoplanes missouriensis TaxID=1866 RepID=UPI0033FF886D
MVGAAAAMLAVAAVVTATPAPALAVQLNQPTNVQVTPGRRAISVTWDAPPDDPDTDEDVVHHYIATTTPGNVTCVTADASRACTIQGLVANTQYTVAVVACPTADNYEDCSEPSDSSAAVLTGPPAVPQTPSATYTGNAREVRISWTQPGITTGIDTFRVTPTPAISGATGTCVADLPDSATSCTLGNLVTGTSYTFKVLAQGVGSTGSSALSAATGSIVAGPPNAPPAAPTVAHQADDTVRLTWNAPSGGTAVGSYTVVSSPSVVSAACTEVVPTTCDFDGLDPGTAYTFTVRANGAGANGGSGPSAATPASAAITPGAPGAMLKPTVTVVGSGQVSVDWAAPTGGATPIDYTVVSDPAEVTAAACDATANTDCVFDGLDPDTEYTFTVVARATGASSTSPDSDAVIPGAPDAPAKPNAVITGDGEVTVSWLPPGGGAVDGYSVSSNEGIIGDCQDIDALECVVTGLDNLTSYTFTVTASNAAGPNTSAWSDAVIPGAPLAPAAPAVEATGVGELTLTWSAGGGGAVTGYTVASDQGAAIPAECVGTLNTTCVVTDLDEDLAYTFTVTARNVLGPVTSLSSSPVIPGPPDEPDTPTVTIDGPGALTLNWATPGGGPVDTYTVTSNSAPIPVECDDDLVTTCSFTGLSESTAYTFTVIANGDVGAPAESASTAAVIAGPPARPAKPTVEVTASGQLTIRWAAPGGGEVASYTVSSDDVDPGCTAIQELECVVSGLDPGTEYDFTVTADAVWGSSPTSLPTDPVTPGAPDVPAPPSVVVTGPGAVDVSWVAPGGGAVTSYLLIADPDVDLPDACVDTTNLTCSITGLDQTTPIAFQIAAGNPVDTATSILSAEVIPGPPGVPDAPGVLVNGSGSVQVSWAMPGGGETTDYTVVSDPEVDAPAGCTGTANTTCTYTGLDPAVSYTFTVLASGPGGDSDPSAASPAVIAGPPSPPAKPAIAVTNTGTITLTWVEPGGGEVTDYTVLSDQGVSVPAECVNDDVLECVISALDPDTGVSFKVRANGVVSYSTSVSSDLIVPGPPDAPAAPRVSLSAPGAATVSWDATSGGGPLTGYTVASDPLVSAPAGCVATGNLQCTYTGLDPDTSYAFRVTAIGPGGGDQSSASAVLVPGRPNAPGTPVVTLDNPGEAIVDWDAPIGGGSIGGYTVTSSPAVTTPAACRNITATNCVFDGLDEETSYTFTVTATNAIDSATSAVSNAVIPGPPTAPGRPQITGGASGSVTLSWAPSGGGELTSYSVTSDPASTPPAGCTEITATTCVFDDLDESTRYTFTVTATGPLGSSPSLESVAVVPGMPDTPHTPMAAPLTPTSVRVTWEAGEEGAPETGFRLVSDPPVTIPAGCVNALVFTCDVTGLTAATEYRFRVYAINNAGEVVSEYSDPIVPGRPADPTEIEVAPGDRQFAVSWTAPPQAAERVAYYRVTTTPDSRTCRTADATTTECVVVGLTNLRWYRVEVVSVGLGGTGESKPGESRLVRPTAGVPSAPSGLAAVGRDGSATVAWAAPESVGNGIAFFTATATAVADPADTHSCVTADTTALSCLITGLTNLREYRVTVVSVGKAASGNSAPSASVTVTPSVPPGAPTITQVTAGARNLTVQFTPGSGVASGFTATATGGTSPLTCTAAASATSCVISGVTPGTSYTVRVYASGTVAGSVSLNSAPFGPVKGLVAAAPALPTTLPTPYGSATSSAGTALRLQGTTTISGTGYAPHTGITVGIYPGANRLATTTTDASGAFSVPVTITGVTTGTGRTILAGGQSSTSTSNKWRTITVSVAAALAPQVSLQRSASLPILSGKLD